MNLRITEAINKNITENTNNTTFNNYITDYSKANRKTFYNLIKDAIYKRYSNKTDYNNLSKMLDLELLDFTFKNLNEHQQKIFIFKSDYINKEDFDNQLKEYQSQDHTFIK